MSDWQLSQATVDPRNEERRAANVGPGDVADRMISLRLPAVLVAELRAVATLNERSLSAEARLALKAWLSANPKKEEQ